MTYVTNGVARDIRPGDKVLHRGDWCTVIAVHPGRVGDITGDPEDLTVESPYYPGSPYGIAINDDEKNGVDGIEGHQWKEHQ